jgi:hypothetical protein
MFDRAACLAIRMAASPRDQDARVRTEMSLQVLAYNVKRIIAIFSIAPLLQAIRS